MRLVAAALAVLLAFPAALLASASPQATPYIIGGVPAPAGAWPSVVAVEVSDGSDAFLCGGTLVEPSWVLTAAHCAVIAAGPAFVLVGLGSQDLSGMQVAAVDDVQVNPGWNSGTFDHDSALLHLAQPTVGIPIAPLLPPGLAGLADNAMAFATGWGDTVGNGAGAIPNHLRQVRVPTITNAACNASYTALGLPSPVTAAMLCAGRPPTLGTCNGDSGGPLWVTLRGVRVQAGIVSWGINGCRAAGAYSVFGRVSEMEPWIESVVGASLAPDATVVLSGIPAWVPRWRLEASDAGTPTLSCETVRATAQVTCIGTGFRSTGPLGTVTMAAGADSLTFTPLDARGDPAAPATVRLGALLPGRTMMAVRAVPAAAIATADVARLPFAAVLLEFEDAAGPVGTCRVAVGSVQCNQDLGLPPGAGTPLGYPSLLLPATVTKVNLTGLDAAGDPASPVRGHALAPMAGRPLRLPVDPVPDGAAVRLELATRPAYDYHAEMASHADGTPIGACDVAAGVATCTGDAVALRGTYVLLPAGGTDLTLSAAGHADATRMATLTAGRTTTLSFMLPVA
jgi:hypothetical protein